MSIVLQGYTMFLKKILLATGTAFFCLNFAYAEACPDFPYFFPKTGTLSVLNCDFHQQYEARIAQVLTTFGTSGGRPIILNLGGTLILKYNGNTTNTNITPATYHELKSFEHAALTVFLILSQMNPDQSTLQMIQSHLEQAAPLISSLKLTHQSREITNQLVQGTLQLIRKLKNKPTYSRDKLAYEFKRIKPLLNKVTMIASKIELQALNDALNPWLAQMLPAERNRIGIVVATAHQARDREISLQYFSKKFGHRVGEGARYENGMVVLEGKFDETSALNLLARHYLDREVGDIMFNEPARLQRDVLADSAAIILRTKK
jgi:hypothetical protein